jgi:hypothetical protein
MPDPTPNPPPAPKDNRSVPLPTELADLDRLTPYATVYRCEHVPEYVALDRKATWSLVAGIRVFVEQHLQFPAQ